MRDNTYSAWQRREKAWTWFWALTLLVILVYLGSDLASDYRRALDRDNRASFKPPVSKGGQGTWGSQR